VSTAITSEVRRRRTFAIISHPDAGKTTLTEKLLLYGGAIHIAGSVRARKAARAAVSDWMELERERGISVTTSVLQFPYRGHHINLLDTPGHEDFSEDTYRTLHAVDSAVMLIDRVKGIEAQTRKLFKVCRLRGIPIFTFINKMDRVGREPLDLMAEIEDLLGIRCCPMNWPIGMGPQFQGVYDRSTSQVHLFDNSEHGTRQGSVSLTGIDDPQLTELLGPGGHTQLKEEIELLDAAGDAFDPQLFSRGEITPVFFGSAMTNFGVEPFLERFVDLAPAPGLREASGKLIEPDSEDFSGFIFKIQANMDRAHRDRVAFLRICSGRFGRGMTVRHMRLGKDVRLANSVQFLAQERTLVEDAYAGDIVGLFDPGIFGIGDTLCSGTQVTFEGVPQFAPEFFSRVVSIDAMKRKQLAKGLKQLTEEGAVQIFYVPGRGEQDPILGAVGRLQFDVIKHRLAAEYGVEPRLEPLNFAMARWITGEGFDAARFNQLGHGSAMLDRFGQNLVLLKGEWELNCAKREFPKLNFLENAPIGKGAELD
jgi:peptide chain release factor 3